MSNNWRNIWNFLLILWHCENGMIQRILWSKNFMNFIVCSTTGVSLYLHIYTVLYGKKQLLGGSTKKLFLKISQNSQENNCIGVFFNKLAGLRSATLLTKEIPTKYFSCKFCKIFENRFFYRLPPSNCFYIWSVYSLIQPITRVKSPKVLFLKFNSLKIPLKFSFWKHVQWHSVTVLRSITRTPASI